MPTIRANDLDIGYEVAGAGPPLVMLHGASSSGRVDFAAQVPVLAEAFLVHLPDARGHAGTRWNPDQGFQFEWLVDDLSAFVDALGIAEFHLLGFSMGALTALWFAARQPARVRTLVVAGISSEREPRATVVRRALDPARIERDEPAWAAALGRRHDPIQGPGSWRRLLPSIAAGDAAQPLLSPHNLHEITAPALVVCGDRDPFVPVDQAWRLARQLHDGHLLVVPDAGHEVMSQRPGLVNIALASFYRATRTIPTASRLVDTVEITAEGRS